MRRMVQTMEQPKLDWANAKANDDASVYVPFHQTLDPAWFKAVGGVLQLRNSEIRGDAWGTVELSADGGGFKVKDVEPGSRHALEGYLENVLSVSAQRYQRDAAGAQQKAQAEASQALDRDERTRRLRDEFESG